MRSEEPRSGDGSYILSEKLVFSPNMRLHAPRQAVLLFLATALLSGRASAQESATIAVDCPALDAESRAAVEARARADLLVRNAPGTFVVVCLEREARLSWHPLAGTPATASAPLDVDPRVSVDRILEGLGGLVTAGAAQADADAVPTGPAVEAPVTADPAANAPPSARPQPPPDVRPIAPVAPDEAWRGGFGGVLLGAGMGGELWSGTAALGPRVSVLLSLPPRFEAGATATVFFTLRAPDQVSGRAVRLALTGSYALDRGERFHVGADVFLDLVHATAPGAGTANDATFGVLVRATGALLVGKVRFELGPTLAIHPTPLRAQIGTAPDGSNGNVAFTLQTFTAGLVLDVLVGPL